jgi:hypothetical protein
VSVGNAKLKLFELLFDDFGTSENSLAGDNTPLLSVVILFKIKTISSTLFSQSIKIGDIISN